MNHKEEFDRKMQNLISNVKNTDAELKDAVSLTEDIIGAIAESGSQERKPLTLARGGLFSHIIFKRIISAAAIILFSLFVYEQYIILDKLNRLEVSRQNIPEQNQWELRTVMKYRQLKANNKVLVNIVESVGNKQEPKPGFLKKYYQYKGQLNMKTRNKMGIQ